MSVMDIETRPQAGLTPAQARLAHGMRHTTVANLRMSQGECGYQVVALHLDMVETAIICLGITGSAKDAFVRLASLPSALVADVLR
jgi:hypothetical protein